MSSNRYSTLDPNPESELTDIEDDDESSDLDELDVGRAPRSSPTPIAPSSSMTAYMQTLIGSMIRPPTTRPVQQPLPPSSPVAKSEVLQFSSPVRGSKEEKKKIRRNKGQRKRHFQHLARTSASPTVADGADIVHPHASVFNPFIARLAQKGIPVSEFFFYVLDPIYGQGTVRWHGFLRSGANVTRTMDILSKLKAVRERVAAWAFTYTEKVIKKEAQTVTKLGTVQSHKKPLDQEFFNGFKFATMKDRLSSLLPITYRMISALATNPKYQKKYSEKRREKKSNVIFTTMLQNLSEFSQKNNVFKKIIGMYMYSTGAQRQSIEVMSHLGLSESYTGLIDKKRKRKRKRKHPEQKGAKNSTRSGAMTDSSDSDESNDYRPGSLRTLSRFMRKVAVALGLTGLFGVVYDNINMVTCSMWASRVCWQVESSFTSTILLRPMKKF
ncbi:hypothetical protein VNI00_011519 [Paramarasmius palmivorus]|uniref:Uncharacterized protein n=1 Tax=Paramarasmius palmivorus TaxID=297713 RepID=A0AAW0CFX8_9AGAR